ncbi:hypothetical protein K1719_019465 [Acacia pycnantha]|nr:hypothetical protein K1719_019465 [Acacia pycnantha]
MGPCGESLLHCVYGYNLPYLNLLCGNLQSKFKGKISWLLAMNAALGISCDALGDNEDNSMGLENKLEARLMNLEGK